MGHCSSEKLAKNALKALDQPLDDRSDYLATNFCVNLKPVRCAPRIIGEYTVAALVTADLHQNLVKTTELAKMVLLSVSM